MSDGNQAAEFILLIGFMVLVGSSLLARRLPIGQSVKMLAAWAILFLVAFVGFTLRHDFAELGRRVVEETIGERAAIQSGETMRIRQAGDGHFWVDAQVNGETVRFLVDSGATITSISGTTARRAGIEPSGGLPVLVNTANGSVTVQRGRAERFRLGSIARENLAVHISDGLGETNVLGMNFLSSLSGWGVEGGWLVLKP